MSNIPSYQHRPPKSGVPTWVWVLLGLTSAVVVCGICGWIMLVIILHPVRGAQKADSIPFASAKNVGLGVMMYSSDYDNRFPPIDTGAAIADRLDKYLNDLMPPKFGRGDGVPLKTKVANYIWNQELSSVKHNGLAISHERGRPISSDLRRICRLPCRARRSGTP
jgi:hypothetical protein